MLQFLVGALVCLATPGAPAEANTTLGRYVALHSLARGDVDDALAKSSDVGQRDRLTRLRDALAQGVDVREAIVGTYGRRWVEHRNRDEIVAVLAGQDAWFRSRLSALEHAQVVGGPRDPHDVFYNVRRGVLPAGAADDGPRTWQITVQVSVTRPRGFLDGPGGVQNIFVLEYDFMLEANNGVDEARFRGTMSTYGITADNARHRFLATQFKGIMGALADDVLRRAELSVLRETDDAQTL